MFIRQVFVDRLVSQMAQGKAVPGIGTLCCFWPKWLKQRPGYFLELDAKPNVEAVVQALKTKAEMPYPKLGRGPGKKMKQSLG